MLRYLRLDFPASSTPTPRVPISLTRDQGKDHEVDEESTPGIRTERRRKRPKKRRCILCDMATGIKLYPSFTIRPSLAQSPSSCS